MQFPDISQVRKRAMLWLGYIVLAVAGYLLIPKDLALKPNIGLECSWMISLNLALLRKAWYGTDYIYTYGPLGFLYTRVLLGQSKWLMVMTDAFVFGNLLYMLYDYLKQSGRCKIVAYTVVILTALLSQHIPCVLTLFIILLYHSAAICFNYRQITSLLFAAVSAALLFFIKLNYGIIGLPIFYLALLIILIQNGTRSVMPVLVSAALNIIIVILLSVSFRVHLFPYLVSGLYLIKDYNDAVATQADYSSFYLFGFAVILVLYFASSLLFFRKYKFKLNIYYLPASLMLSLFLAFKNGFVRPDDIHMTGAYLILPFLTMVPVVLSPYKLMRSWYKRLHIITLCFCLFFWRGPYNIYGHDLYNSFRTNYGKEILKSSAELNTYNLELQQKQEVSRLKSAIAGGTVDIYPYMVIYAYAAGLNYSPRPVPQSYQPYDLFLDSVNSLKYENDSRAPGYLLFANAAIDERYPFADESVTKRAMLQYYRATDTFKLTDFVDRDDTALVILFKRREFPLKMNLISCIEKRAALNEWIAPDTSSAVQYVYANIDFSYAGDLRRILFQSPRLKMRVRFEDGSEKDYSAIVPILKTGIVFNKQVNTTADAWTFFSTNGEGCKKVKAAKFYADNPAMFKKDFKITLKTFQVTD